MKPKPLLRPDRLRHVPRQFSWIDQRFVRHRHITRCRPPALALYLFLIIVADEQGMSYYSDAKAADLLSLSREELKGARRELIQAGVIAFTAPYYQVLSLDYLESGSQNVPSSALPEPEAVRRCKLSPLARRFGRCSKQKTPNCRQPTTVYSPE